MSEQWNGIYLADVRNSFFNRLSGALDSVRRLVAVGINHAFDTATNGAVIVTNNYLDWEFVSPNNYSVASGTTVADLLSNLEVATESNPVTAWDEFAAFLDTKKSTINMFLTEGGAATITVANGDTFSATSHKLTTITDFPDMAAWLATWFGSDLLAESSSALYLDSKTIQFSLTASGTTIACTFKF